MEVTKEQIGEPICACDAIKAIFKQDKKGIWITFILNPEDVSSALMETPIGEVVRLFVTKPDMGA